MLLGAALSSLIGWFGYRRHALSPSGAVGATIVGTPVFAFTGLAGGALLVAFFLSSSILSRFQEHRKVALCQFFSKGSKRDLGQALANGGVAALAASMYSIVQTDWAWAALVGALAAATADTWATELGVLSKQRPRLISTGTLVTPGTSGGVTMYGTLAAAGGATCIAGVAAFFHLEGAAPLFLIGTFSGLLGSVFDSLLGATVQQVYRCSSCAKDTERYPLHSCGEHTHRLRGWRWMTNDWVNFLATALAALVAAAITAHVT